MADERKWLMLTVGCCRTIVIIWALALLKSCSVCVLANGSEAGQAGLFHNDCTHQHRNAWTGVRARVFLCV